MNLEFSILYNCPGPTYTVNCYRRELSHLPHFISKHFSRYHWRLGGEGPEVRDGSKPVLPRQAVGTLGGSARTFAVLRWGLLGAWTQTGSSARLGKGSRKTAYTRFAGSLDVGVEGMKVSRWLGDTALCCIHSEHRRRLKGTWGAWLLYTLSRTRKTWK